LCGSKLLRVVVCHSRPLMFLRFVPNSPIPAAIQRRYAQDREGCGRRVGRNRSAAMAAAAAASAMPVALPQAVVGGGGGMGQHVSSLHFGGIAQLGAVAACCVVLAHCSGPFSSKEYSPRVVEEGEPVPKGGGIYRVGKPYSVNGRTY